MKNLMQLLPTIFFGLGFIAFFGMIEELRQRKIVKYRWFGLNAFVIFKEYMRVTKEEYGYTGFWFWMALCCFMLTIISALLNEIV
jgi:hypothetical protein